MSTDSEAPETDEEPTEDDPPQVDPELNDEGWSPATDERLDHLPESVRARAPEDPDAIAWEEDFLVRRDDEGEVLPKWEPLPGVGKEVCVVPLTQDEIAEWLPASGDPTQLDDAAVVALLKEFYLVPDFEAAGVETKDDVKNFVGFGVDPALGALLNASGMDMARGMFAQNSQLIDLIEGNSKGGS